MSETKRFEQFLQSQGALTTTRTLPPRTKTSGPRTGARLSDTARAAGDCFYNNAKPLAKFLYTKIEQRFKDFPNEATYRRRQEELNVEVKSILNEHRNQIVEAVLPMYDIRFRGENDRLSDDEPLPAADAHARDFFVKNVFTMYYRELLAWLPEFVGSDNVPECEEVLARLSTAHREQLESELRNFRFGFRRIVAPQ